LTGRYQAGGRKAFHPSNLLGLIVYGILNRQWSLRELEGLARRDTGACWLCGGHQPDHSTIGKFITLPAKVLTEEFFVGLVKHLAARLKLSLTLSAGDGTLMDTAASRFLACCSATQPHRWPRKRAKPRPQGPMTPTLNARRS
jgi:transposase